MTPKEFRNLTVIMAISFAFACCFVSCSTTQKKTDYNTLYSLEASTGAAYHGYLTEVVTGKVSTNDVPKVSGAYNKFQIGINTAAEAVQFNWSNAAPAAVIGLAGQVLNAIIEAKGSK